MEDQNEELKQENHVLKFALQRQKLIVDDLRADAVINEGLEEEVKQLRAEKRALLDKCELLSKQVSDYAATIEEHEQAKAVEDLEKIEDKVVELLDFDPLQEILKKDQEIADLKCENAVLTTSAYAMKMKLQELNILLVNSTEANLSLTREVVQFKEALQVSRESADHAQDCYQESREEIALLQANLDGLKDGSVCARGNSLFGEVDVSRQKLLKRYNDLKSFYQHLQVAYARKCADYSKLYAEKASMVRERDDALNDFIKLDADKVRSLERRVRELMDANARLTDMVKTPVKIVADLGAAELKFIEDMVSNAANDVRVLEIELEQRSVALIASAHKLNATQREMMLVKSESLRKTAELAVANQTIATLEDKATLTAALDEETNSDEIASAAASTNRITVNEAENIVNGKDLLKISDKSNGVGDTAPMKKVANRVCFEVPFEGHPSANEKDENAQKSSNAAVEKRLPYVKIVLPPVLSQGQSRIADDTAKPK